MKSINYRGGIARFNLPSSWVEEYQPEGGGTFFEDRPDSGTLRINVLSISKQPNGGQPAETVEEVIQKISDTSAVRRLPSGAVIAQSTRPGFEDGQDLLLYTWYIGVPLDATNIRIIIFTHTILAAQKSDPNVQQEIVMLNRSISEGEYSAARGVSGNYVQ